ncbi:MAG: hypothetical protein A2Z31_08945 [candidate division NC10 bacterium RBG_16_65_8]|nr:MAG: hypothetical protein A2Z31_08945 [candidate division NC10 bacterium RBG_16_65_8]
MAGRPALVAVAGRTESERVSRLRLFLSSWRRIEFRRQRLGAGDDSRDIRVFAGFRRGVGLTLPGFEPTSVLPLLPLLSGLFLCPLLKARP